MKSHHLRACIVRGAITMVLGLAALADATPAQTRFTWPSDTGDVTRYTTPEECLAATMRVRRRVESWADVWADTLILSPERARMPLPGPVVETARRCGARFVASAMPVTDFAPLMHLFLFAQRDADAGMIIQRRLAAIAPTGQRERMAVLDSAMQGYLFMAFGPYLELIEQPVRLAAVESLLVETGRLPDSLHSAEDRLGAPFELMRASISVGDTARVRRVAERTLALYSRLTSAERRTPFVSMWGPMLSYTTRTTILEPMLLDSLRRGTPGYVALQQETWAKASGERPEALHFPIGRHAPPIDADFWFRRNDSSSTRPTKGKVSLVVFLDWDCRLTSGGACWPASASLHRLGQRFPRLEITSVTRTRGWFSEMTPPTPAEESQALREWWQGFHQLPGALAVKTTDFWRLDPPDLRRVDRPTSNETNYSFGRSWQLEPGMAFLVDKNGVIVEVGNLGVHDTGSIPDVEEHFAQLIEILLTRSTPMS
jgi:hypothetical protein